MKLTPPLKWHGGKNYLARRIVALMPTHLHYVEPFFGGGAVLLEKYHEGISEVVNDLNGELVWFWQVLAHESLFKEFVRKAEATPFCESVYEAACACHESGTVQAAWAFFVKCRQSLAGRMKGFAPLSKKRVRRGMNEQASAWLTAVEGLPAVHERLKRVVILNHDAFDVIREQDGKDTLFYCDPPYLHDTRAGTNDYDHEMTTRQHGQLLELLAEVKGKFLLSGYPHPLYERWAEANGWRHVDFDLPNNAAGGEEKRRMVERLWMNF